ncbi:L,D-transpeptidase family protein [Vibrio sp. MA40-2]|uniref:L,D-transpeptidase family protein n=1 Tax=Vibrio sp. MA40-2 TaxID=3391828 RepID=UPI0039A502AE
MKCRLFVSFWVLWFSASATALEDLPDLRSLDFGSQFSLEITYPEIVHQVYAAEEFQLIWHDPTLSQQFESMLIIMHYSGLSELFSSRLTTLQQYRRAGLWYKYDVTATDTLLNYMHYVSLVSSQGAEWYYGNNIQLPTTQLEPALVNSLINTINQNRLRDFIASLHATPEHRDSLKHAVTILSHAIDTGVDKYQQDAVAHKGDILLNKAQLLARLDVVGLTHTSNTEASLIFDDELYQLVKQFQTMHGLKPDGVIGKETLYWINVSPQQRLHSLALNTERSRLMPKDRQNIIIVNLPNFQLSYWHNGEARFTSKVIVGNKKRKTPLLSIKMDTLIFNPSWNVPRKLVREDIIPKIKKDENYLERMNMKVIKSWRTREEIDPSTIDWQTIEADNFAYNMTQGPGKQNALGELKFNTPNARAIYLHDTPAKYLFNKTYRAFSAGCIRVQYADKFANTLMQVQGIEPPKQSVGPPVSAKVALRQQIPVHLVYQTAWIKDDVVQYRKDIYGYDKTPSRLVLTQN